MRSVVIVDGVRTPQGNLGGVFKDLSAQKLGEIALRALLERTKLNPKEVGEVVFGCVGQQSDAPNISRVIALMSKLPIEIPAFTVQRNCASGLQAVVSGYQMIALGEADVVIAGGTESMSGAPYVSRDLRFGKKLRHSMMVDTLWEGLTDPIVNQIMGETAENLVKEFGISRKEQDEFALLSHQRAFRATREGKFKDEMVKVMVPKKVMGKEVASDPISADEGPNPGLTEQILSQYPAIFKENGSVTPGNSCPISDGAACVLLMSEEKAKASGYKPLGYIRSYGFAGVEPDRMGIGPTCAVPIALKRAGVSLKDMQLIEINEAFAAQIIACERVMKYDRNIANVNGGAIALGHPVGATGTRVLVT
ncbi:MAG: thiolase family protein, partial [Candidatus Omnitrophica bacterium]|nr:thiolase family protein [Candidatus Omnitrophota bacterium]